MITASHLFACQNTHPIHRAGLNRHLVIDSLVLVGDRGEHTVNGSGFGARDC
jgi:hypothetical protein